MTEQIKPKQCGKTAWYIPNQKGFVPNIREQYWVIDSDLDPRQLRHTGSFCDYSLIDAKNCFETEQEAIDAARLYSIAFAPTPLTKSDSTIEKLTATTSAQLLEKAQARCMELGYDHAVPHGVLIISKKWEQDFIFSNYERKLTND